MLNSDYLTFPRLRSTTFKHFIQFMSRLQYPCSLCRISTKSYHKESSSLRNISDLCDFSFGIGEDYRRILSMNVNILPKLDNGIDHIQLQCK